MLRLYDANLRGSMVSSSDKALVMVGPGYTGVVHLVVDHAGTGAGFYTTALPTGGPRLWSVSVKTGDSLAVLVQEATLWTGGTSIHWRIVGLWVREIGSPAPLVGTSPALESAD